MSAGEPFRVGARVGGLDIVRELGAGGMGAVFLARHPESGARYALKCLPRHADAQQLLRFQREGEAQARVDAHPNVVRVHSLSQTDDGRPYLILEAALGGDLSRRIAREPLAPTEAARIVRDLARGLAHVHAQGVLHRDLKPANVLFDERGTPKLVDFGLAKLVEGGTLTATGSLLGTPDHMAPEQVTGNPGAVDERTDVHGLGTVLYHALTGRAPFRGPSVLEVLRCVTHELPAPPHAVAPGVPRSLSAVCMSALAKRPEDRPPSAQALADELERFLAGELREGSTRPALGLAALAGAAIVAGLLLSTDAGETSVESAAKSAQPAPAPSRPAKTPTPRQAGVPRRRRPFARLPAALRFESQRLYREGRAKSRGGHLAEAWSLYQQAAAIGHPKALRRVGMICALEGEARRFGLELDFERGVRCLREAARNDDLGAWFYLGRAYDELAESHPRGSAERKAAQEQAQRWHEQGAAKGNPWSMHAFARVQRDRGNLLQAIRVFDRLIERRQGPWQDAALALGRIHMGNKTEASLGEAELLFSKAWKAGSVRAGVALAELFRHTKRAPKAAGLLGELRHKDSSALVMLSRLYRLGEGVEQSRPGAQELLRQAAYRGNHEAMLELGEHDTRPFRSVRWFLRSAVAGSEEGLERYVRGVKNGYQARGPAPVLRWFSKQVRDFEPQPRVLRRIAARLKRVPGQEQTASAWRAAAKTVGQPQKD